MDHSSRQGSGFLQFLTNTPDGSTISEIMGGADFRIVREAFSCILSGSGDEISTQYTALNADVRGWMCFDIAGPSTVVDAIDAGAPRFGQECSNGEVIGDGIIGIEDIVIVL